MPSVLLLLYASSLLTISLSIALSNYSCGATGFSTWSSYIMTMNCDQDAINSCCSAHDACYSACQHTQLDCDRTFCDCLHSLPSSMYCRNVVHATHCSLVQWFGHEFMCPNQSQPPFGGTSNNNIQTQLPYSVTPVQASSGGDSDNIIPGQPYGGNGLLPGQPPLVGNPNGYNPLQIPNNGGGFIPGQPNFGGSSNGFNQGQLPFSGIGAVPVRPYFGGNSNGYNQGQLQYPLLPQNPLVRNPNGLYPGLPYTYGGIGSIPGQPNFGGNWNGVYPGQSPYTSNGFLPGQPIFGRSLNGLANNNNVAQPHGSFGGNPNVFMPVSRKIQFLPVRPFRLTVK